ncbi:MAG: hypothetical protein LUD74_03190 [Tannerellaceae bacterium]|nr:hypothetical protein [Tannerellaceae bacterium]
MQIKKGTTRKAYTTQFTDWKPFKIVEDDMQALLRQAITVAGFIRYYNINNQVDGYFDELLPELTRFCEHRDELPGYGNLEPSQALLYAFLQHLHTVSATFNQRWEKFAGWYLDEVLRVTPLPPLPHRVWITLQKNTRHNIQIPTGTSFLLQIEKKEQGCFLTVEALEVNNIELQQVLTWHVERNKQQLPAGYLNYVTSIRKKELSGDNPFKNKELFGKDLSDGSTQPIGIQVAHPSLLLREGKRYITLTLISSGDQWHNELERAISVIRKNLPGWSREKIVFGLFDQLFHLSISSNEGWSDIPEYIVNKTAKGIQIRFTCPEDFPATIPCSYEIHKLESPYPVLRILLNTENWFYPYSWLSHFYISSIKIHTRIEEIRNVQLYNELGEVDTAKPFHLFGINTEKECWFVIGNYEMSLKQLKSVSLHIRWDQLPGHPKGMAGHYQGYEKEINNHSFRLRSYYLNDYNWHPTTDKKQFPLFRSERSAPGGDSLPDAPLAKDIRINNIQLANMPPLQAPEEHYFYSIRSRAGFIRFRLEAPEIGFGEKLYRILFTNRIMAHSLKKKGLPELNTPVVPAVEQLTLSYTSEDSIDLNNPTHKQPAQVYQYYPLGSYPLIGTNIVTPSFCYRMETDANLLFLLSGVKAGEILTLYLDFTPSVHANTEQPQPLILWYWGNGYQWQELPKEAIEKDTTSNLLHPGYLKIHFPNSIARHIYDENGNLWLRAGIITNASGITGLEHVYTHVVQLCEQLPGQPMADCLHGNTPANWLPEKNFPELALSTR